MPSENTTNEKPVISFRFSMSLVAWLRNVSKRRDWSMNEYVVRALEGIARWWGLPEMMRKVLEQDREAMGLDHYDYFGHLVARRYLEIRDNGGPGFEKKEAKKPRK